MEIELGNADAQQLQGMLLRFFPDAQAHAARLVADYPVGAMSPAQIQKILIAADSANEAEAGLRTAFKAANAAAAAS